MTGSELCNIEESFITLEECAELVAWFEQYPHKNYDGLTGSYWDGSPVKVYSMENYTPTEKLSESIVYNVDCNTINMGNDVLDSIRDRINYSLDASYYNKYITFNKMYPGAEINPHVDGYFVNEVFEPRPNMKTIVVYLNEEFSGGELVLNNRLTYAPIPGAKIVFAGGVSHHSVKKIESGTRYTIVLVYDKPSKE
jgi:hypothetical protein